MDEFDKFKNELRIWLSPCVLHILDWAERNLVWFGFIWGVIVSFLIYLMIYK